MIVTIVGRGVWEGGGEGVYINMLDNVDILMYVFDMFYFSIGRIVCKCIFV